MSIGFGSRALSAGLALLRPPECCLVCEFPFYRPILMWCDFSSAGFLLPCFSRAHARQAACLGARRDDQQPEGISTGVLRSKTDHVDPSPRERSRPENPGNRGRRRRGVNYSAGPDGRLTRGGRYRLVAGRSSGFRLSGRQTRCSALGGPILPPRLPIPATHGDSGMLRRSSPVTAARPRPILTAFPFVPAPAGTPATPIKIHVLRELSSAIAPDQGFFPADAIPSQAGLFSRLAAMARFLHRAAYRCFAMKFIRCFMSGRRNHVCRASHLCSAIRSLRRPLRPWFS